MVALQDAEKSGVPNGHIIEGRGHVVYHTLVRIGAYLYTKQKPGIQYWTKEELAREFEVDADEDVHQFDQPV